MKIATLTVDRSQVEGYKELQKNKNENFFDFVGTISTTLASRSAPLNLIDPGFRLAQGGASSHGDAPPGQGSQEVESQGDARARGVERLGRQSRLGQQGARGLTRAPCWEHGPLTSPLGHELLEGGSN